MIIEMNLNPNDSFDQYLSQFEPLIQTRLTKVYTFFQQALPEAKFIFSYQMPTFKGEKNLVHFAGYTNHIGIYPGPQGIQMLLETFPTIRTSNGTWLIPHTQPIPVKALNVMTAWIRAQNFK
jgi:uncharacterized protein YdhG (YjbR/CyaY superfamily)